MIRQFNISIAYSFIPAIKWTERQWRRIHDENNRISLERMKDEERKKSIVRLYVI